MLATLFNDWGEWFPTLLGGLGVSVRLTGAILLLGLPLGIVLALLAESRRLPVRLVTGFVVELGRGTPTLVMIYLVYFGLPPAGISFSAFAAATVAFALNVGAYSSEIFRAGLKAVPRGQRDAAMAIGLTPARQLVLIVLPQALRIVIPPILGYAIIVFQGTSLAFVIGIPELLSRAYEIGSATFQFFSVLTLAGLMYAVVAIPAARLIGRLEAGGPRRSRSFRRRALLARGRS